MTSASTARFPRVVMTRSCDILQFDQSGDRSLLGSPTPVCVTNGPVLQPVAAPAAIFDALHGMSGHLSSSTRTLPPYRFHFFHSGVIGRAVTVTSGNATDPSAPSAPTDGPVVASMQTSAAVGR